MTGKNDGQGSARLNFLNKNIIDHIDRNEDLIIVQLGDNVNTENKRLTFQKDAKEMIKWFMTQFPDVKILWVYDW